MLRISAPLLHTLRMLAIGAMALSLGPLAQGQSEKPTQANGSKKPMNTETPEATPKPKPKLPTPTYTDVSYGPDVRNVMDVWLASSDKPTPCVMYIHGGGWLGGDKSTLNADTLKKLLDAGISVAAINYRYLKQTIIDTGSKPGEAPIQPRGAYAEPPVKEPLSDAARALQFLRHNAAKWNIDPQRVGLTGGSAGACSSLWLTFHDDLADPNSADPIARESTKPWCAAVEGAQTTLDPVQILEWTPNSTYGGHAFGYIWDSSDKTSEIRSFLKDRESVKEWIAEYSPYALASEGDPAVYLLYKDGPPARGKEMKDPTHTCNYGAILVEKLDKIGVPYEFVHTGVTEPRFPDIASYLIYKLKE